MTPTVTRRAKPIPPGGKPRTPTMRLHILCPNCDQPAKASHKRQLSRIVTELVYNCTTPACGCAFVFVGEVHRLLRMPAHMRPGLNIALSPSLRRRELTEALRTLPTAKVPEGEFIPPLPEREPTAPPARPVDQTWAVPAPTVPVTGATHAECGHWSHLLG